MFYFRRDVLDWLLEAQRCVAGLAGLARECFPFLALVPWSRRSLSCGRHRPLVCSRYNWQDLVPLSPFSDCLRGPSQPASALKLHRGQYSIHLSLSLLACLISHIPSSESQRQRYASFTCYANRLESKHGRPMGNSPHTALPHSRTGQNNYHRRTWNIM